MYLNQIRYDIYNTIVQTCTRRGSLFGYHIKSYYRNGEITENRNEEKTLDINNHADIDIYYHEASKNSPLYQNDGQQQSQQQQEHQTIYQILNVNLMMSHQPGRGERVGITFDDSFPKDHSGSVNYTVDYTYTVHWHRVMNSKQHLNTVMYIPYNVSHVIYQMNILNSLVIVIMLLLIIGIPILRRIRKDVETDQNRIIFSMLMRRLRRRILPY
jgi:Endomembrane protein 70